MGTRGSFGVRIGGVDKLSYNHSDSYPEGLGQEFVAQVRELVKLSETVDIKALAANMRLVSSGSPPTEADIKKCAHLSDLKVSEGKITDWYCLLRNAQGNLVEMLKLGLMLDGSGHPGAGVRFMLDSLFCEFAYVLNLDTGMVEFYKGFNHHKLEDKGRYANQALPLEDYQKKRGLTEPEYYGVVLVGEFPMTAIPEDWQDKLFPPGKDDE